MFFGSLAFVFEVMVYVGLGLPLVNLLIGLIGGAGHQGADAGGELAAGDGPDFDVDMEVDLDADIDLDMDVAMDAGFEADVDGFDAGGAETAVPGAAAGHGAPEAPHGFPLRFNLYCLCFAMVVMGAFGIFALLRFAGALQIVMLGVGLALALTAYILLYRLVVLPLKRNDARALNRKSLRFRHVKVSFRITRDSPGTIQTRDAVGASISYRAELDTDLCKLERIEEGEEVVVTDVDGERNVCYVAPARRKLLK